MSNSYSYQTFERYFVGIIALITAGILVYLSLLGPLYLGNITYKTSPSAEYQTIGQDLINLLILSPLLIAGGVLLIMNDLRAKHFLILTPIYLMYYALSYGIGMEWNDSRYSGNSYTYFWAFAFVIISALILLMFSVSRFGYDDSPIFSRRQVIVYIFAVGLFLTIFAIMWIEEVVQVIQTGDTSSGSYSSAPTIFWVIRYFDLGISIPLGFISLYLLGTRPKSAYPYLLLFFGFFVTQILAVNSMAAVMWYNNDPELQQGDLYVFWVLGLLTIAGYLFLVKDKLREALNL